MVKYNATEKESLREHVRTWQGSGRSIKSYCDEHGIKQHTFRYWKNQVLGSEKPVKEFIALPLSVSSPVMEVIMSGPTTIRFNTLVPVEYIKALCSI